VDPHAAPVRGRLLAYGDLLFATVDLRPGLEPIGAADRAGIACFDRDTGEEVWRLLDLPPLCTLDDRLLYAYGRGGIAVALGFDGVERWRTRLPDDRSDISRERDDRDGPLPADVVPTPDGVVVAAGPELLLLRREDGVINIRRRICSGTDAIVARVSHADGAIVCTCTRRSAADDDPAATERRLWAAPRTLESRRTGGGDLVAVSTALKELWRLPPPLPGLVWGERRPVAGPENRLFAATALSAGPALSIFDDTMVVLEQADGSVAAAQAMPGGRGHFDPVATVAGVLAGYEPVMYGAHDGEPRWSLSRSLHLDTTLAPTLDGERLLFAGDGRLVGVGIWDGTATEYAPFARRPFAGSVTTNLCLTDGVVYAGVQEADRPVELRALPANT
jgi:outer membrane protein assembly factor BamB